jgi:carbamoyltransferase
MAGPVQILGLSAYYHDAAACLLRDGVIVAAAQEERFSRRKNDERFPCHAVEFCLRQGGSAARELAAVVFYDKPILKFTRMLESYLTVAPAGWRTFTAILPTWFSEKLDLRKTIRTEIPDLPADVPILFTEHHQSHAAAAFFPSPFEQAAILTCDGVGEWATTTLGEGRGREIHLRKELRFPHSLGLLYSAFTSYCGFRINSGEYKLMGLAPYGEPRYAEAIRRELIDLKEDGSLWLNLEYFHFLRGTTMTNERFHRLFGGRPRLPEGPLEPRHLDVARSIQAVTEEAMLRLARHAREITGLPQLCLAGGVALNCVANGRLLRERVFERLWIQPAAGDAGGALGAALAVWHGRFEGGRNRPDAAGPDGDAMQAALLGPAFTDEQIEQVLREHGAVYERLDRDAMLERTVGWLATEKVVGWFQGRMEFGPRALGNRSILGDPRSPRMQSVMNLKVKFRESFRPFAPVVLREYAADYFDLDAASPYMLLVAPVRPALRRPLPDGLRGLALLPTVRSSLPAVTHVDYSARIQTVDRAQNPLLYDLLQSWRAATGCAVLVNTSFNVRGEPVVCTPDDAYRCFVNTEMDALVIGSFGLERASQPNRRLERQAALQPD